MDLGLIVPEKQGGQYDFDERCQKDLEDIISLKGMGFTLNEIKSIFLFIRFASLTQYEENECFRELFINKKKLLENQIEELMSMKANLDENLLKLSEKHNNNKHIIGIDLRTLKLLSCFKCGHELELLEGTITSNQIINGKLTCSCGEEYIIKDGILIVDNKLPNDSYKFDFTSIAEYISDTNKDYLDKVYNSMEWLYKKTDLLSFENKVILELGSGMGFFLRNIYKQLPDSSVYIAVDHDINKHKFLKNVLELSGCKKNVIFICADFLNLPLKDNSIDILADISGTSNYSFSNEEFLLKLINSFIKEDAYLIGSYILFKNFAADTLIDQVYRKNFMLGTVKEQLSGLKYNVLEEKTTDYIEKGGKYENYFKTGEKVYTYLLLGKRLG